jgi:hypothetical protein
MTVRTACSLLPLRGMGMGKGIAARAAILIIGLIVFGVWLLVTAMKIAGAIVHFLFVAALVLIVAGVIAFYAHKFKRRV